MGVSKDHWLPHFVISNALVAFPFSCFSLNLPYSLSLSYPTALSVLGFSLKFISLFTAPINPICPDECALILMCLPSLNGFHPLKPVHLFFWHRLHLSFIVEIHNSEYYYKEMPQRSISLLYRTSVYVKKLFQIATIFYISELLGRR